jgi:hypothetical protein
MEIILEHQKKLGTGFQTFGLSKWEMPQTRVLSL